MLAKFFSTPTLLASIICSSMLCLYFMKRYSFTNSLYFCAVYSQLACSKYCLPSLTKVSKMGLRVCSSLSGISLTYFAGSASVSRLLYLAILSCRSLWKERMLLGTVVLTKDYLRRSNDFAAIFTL